MRKELGLLWVVLAMLLLIAPAHGANESTDVRLLMASPRCVEQRLGQVTVGVGSKDPNPRTGMAPRGVSYQRAFEKLAEAAAEKGGNAVVLRHHQADYFTKGARRPLRPTYVSLQGAVVLLAAHDAECPLALIDPSEFEEGASTKPRTNEMKDGGVSF